MFLNKFSTQIILEEFFFPLKTVKFRLENTTNRMISIQKSFNYPSNLINLRNPLGSLH